MSANDGLARQPAPVCFVTQSRAFGGVEVHTLGLMKALIERGYRIEMISCRHRMYDEPVRARGWQERVRIIHTDLSVGLGDELAGATDGWRDVFRSVESDVLIFPKATHNQGSFAFLRLCRRAFRKVFLIEHLEDPMPQKFSRRLLGFLPTGIGLWWYKKRLLNRLRPLCADHVIAVSDKVRDRLTLEWGVPPQRVTVIRNGVAWRTLARNAEQGAAFRASHSIPEDAFVFGMVARLRSEKGIDIALRAMRHLLDTGTPRPVYLVIAGQGPDEAELKGLSEELRLTERVRFIGFVSEVRTVLSGFDSILFPSRLEGLPLGLLEGMAAGCIPIVTRISGMPEVVDSPQVGWVVAPESPQELADAMASVLALDQQALSAMRDRVTRRIQEHFDIDVCHRRFLECFGL